MNAVEIRNLSYSYSDGTLALNNLTINIPRYHRVAILGANGSGKTTLLHHLNGLIMPQKGCIKILDRTINKKELKKIRQQVGMVFDNPDNQLICTTVAEDIAFGLRNLKLDEETVQLKVKEVMEKVNISDLAERPPFNLSLGQKKRVAVAGVLAMDPEILVIDEPFSGLDPASVRQLNILLQKLHLSGCTIIITTHEVDKAYAWADKVLILAKGEVIADGTVELFHDKELMHKASLEAPTLVNVFNGTGLYPRTPEEANEFLLYGKRSNKVAK